MTSLDNGPCPTEKQHGLLLTLGSGSAGLAWRKRDTEQLLRRGWATAELDGRYYSWVRITPAGLQALARSVERYGLPKLGPQSKTTRRECADCGSDRFRYVPMMAEEVIASAR